MSPEATEPSLLPARRIVNASAPDVVAIGGGHGLAQALQACVRYARGVTAVVTVADDGGSSGRLAPGLRIPPPGDIRRCLLALTPEDSIWKRLFEYRFGGGDVEGHSLGNLIIASLADLEGDFEAALAASERLLRSAGSVVPASPIGLELRATVSGRDVAGQAAIASSRGTIERLEVLPSDAPASERAVAAISSCDQIVLGPGSLYTSVMAVLMVRGIRDAINASEAQLVYVANLITQDGETLGMDGADHLDALLTMTGVRPPACVVANDAAFPVAEPLELVTVDRDVVATYGADVEFADLRDPAVEWPRHDPARLAGVLERVFASGSV